VGKGLSAKPRGLSLGNNILILFQKETSEFMFILSSWQRRERAKGMHAVVCMQFPG
jgi:hypothetical protein